MAQHLRVLTALTEDMVEFPSTTLQLPVTPGCFFFFLQGDPEASSGFCSDLCTHGAPTFQLVQTNRQIHTKNKSLRSCL